MLASPEHLLPQGDHQVTAATDNPSGDHDGFYYALFEKSAA